MSAAKVPPPRDAVGTQDEPALPRIPATPSAPRTLTSYARRDVRNTVAKVRGW